MDRAPFVHLLLDLRTAQLRVLERRDNLATNELGTATMDRGAVAEWLWVTCRPGGDRIGLAFVDFYAGSKDVEDDISKMTSIVETEEGFVFPSSVESGFELDAGPYLPVYCYSDSSGPRYLFIPDATDSADPVLQRLGAIDL